MTETQARFLRDAATRLPLDRVVEVHLFPPITQGGVETGIALIAASRVEEPAPVEPPGPEQFEFDEDIEVAFGADWAEPEMIPVETSRESAIADADAAGVPDEAPAPRAMPPLPERHTVFSARYRLWLKGPERGRWEVDVVEEADAPLVAVGAVVRGILRRGGGDVDPDRIDADTLRTLAASEPAAASPRPVGGAGSARPAGGRR